MNLTAKSLTPRSSTVEKKPQPLAKPALTAIGIFLLFGATMAALAGVILLNPGTWLDHLWT